MTFTMNVVGFEASVWETLIGRELFSCFQQPCRALHPAFIFS